MYFGIERTNECIKATTIAIQNRNERMHKNNIGCWMANQESTCCTHKLYQRFLCVQREKNSTRGGVNKEGKGYVNSKYLCWNWNNSVLIFTSVSSLNLVVCFIFHNFHMMILAARKMVVRFFALFGTKYENALDANRAFQSWI